MMGTQPLTQRKDVNYKTYVTEPRTISEVKKDVGNVPSETK